MTRSLILLTSFVIVFAVLGGAMAQEQAAPAEPELLACQETLQSLWALASDACAAGPIGFICNGGSAPQAEPAGPVANALASVGALVETDAVEAVRTIPIITEVTGGGVMWLRWGTPHYATGLMIGDVTVRDLSPPEFPRWTNMMVQTGIDRPDCPTTPHNTFVLQSQQGLRTRVVVNGVSIDLSGTVAVRTIENNTYFVGMVGQSSVFVRGFEQPLWNGQQVIVPYAPGDFSQPAGDASQTAPLEPPIIEFLPTGLMDQPTWLPQPGYVATQGEVNMRADPSLQGALIARIPANETLSVLGQNPAGDWLHVSLSSGISGWMFAELLSQNLGNVQAVYEATPQPPQRYGTLNTVARVRAPAGINIRENPSAAFPALGVLPDGVQVNMLARSPYSPWVKVEAEGGQSGWVALIGLDTRSNVNALPVDNNVPPPPAPIPPTPAPGSFGNAFPDPGRPSF